MKNVIRGLGILSAILAVFHAAFWWLFDWPARLGYMTAEHRMLMQTFNLCMLPLFLFSTYVFLALPEEILDTRMGRAVLAMNASVYYLRAVSELVFGDIATGESQFFLVLGLVLGALFTWPLLRTSKVSRP